MPESKVSSSRLTEWGTAIWAISFKRTFMEVAVLFLAEAGGICEIYFTAEGEEDNNEEDTKHNQVISYNQDAPYIISGFLECYGIDLTEIPYMHWWKFQMLIDGMNEDCELKKRMGYRSIDLNQIKDKEERISRV